MSDLWIVIGGDLAGVYKGVWCVTPERLLRKIIVLSPGICSPHLRCGKSTPPLPIAIQCKSQEEATLLMCTLEPVLNSMPSEPSPSLVLRLFSASPAVQNLLKDDQDGFYPVVVGAPSGIHRTL